LPESATESLLFAHTMRVAAALAILLSAAAALAQQKTYNIAPDPKNSAIFDVEDMYDKFLGKTSKISGTIVADPAKPGAASVDLTIDLNSLDTGVGLRNREMREKYLETVKWPNGTFKSVSVAGPDSIAPNAPVDVKVTGDLTIHNVTRRVTVPVRIVLIPDGRIHATTSFNVRMPDYDIHVPHNILVTVDDQVGVRVEVWAAAK
jgi:polyisoprenoid-binding protein YceI